MNFRDQPRSRAAAREDALRISNLALRYSGKVVSASIHDGVVEAYNKHPDPILFRQAKTHARLAALDRDAARRALRKLHQLVLRETWAVL